MVMTEEQCTHLRETIARCRKIGEIGTFTAGGVEALLDTIDALRDELERLRSAPVAVEVPELADSDLPNGGHYDIGGEDRVFRRGYALAVSRIRAIPSYRALKEGEVAVPVAYLEALQSAANRSCSSCRDSEVCTMTTRHLGGLGCGAWKLDGARINALRSQRAAEGGGG